MLTDKATRTDELVDAISETVRQMQDELDIEIPDSLGRDTVLFGRQGILDSLGLVSFVVAVEQAIEDRFRVQVSLADERAMSQTNSPYRTVGSLAEYAASFFEAS